MWEFLFILPFPGYRNRPDGLQQDIETVYLELTSHAPAGSVPHVWK